LGSLPLTRPWPRLRRHAEGPADNRHAGHYSLQIYDSLRPHYASGDRALSTATEYQANALGISTHFGTLQVDPAAGVLTLNVESASFPNQDGQQQKRFYKLDGDELSYRVQARPNGDVPVSVWRRLK
jgi:hypothetical protein